MVPPSKQAGISAFDWDAYKTRKSALQHLRHNRILVDTILESEDGAAREPVHSQIISALGDKLTKYLEENGRHIPSETYLSMVASDTSEPTLRLKANRCAERGVKLVRLCKVNKYTLTILAECAYTGYIRADLQSGGIWQVLEVACHYEMADVIRACCNFLVNNLNRSNCIKFYHIGLKHHNPLLRGAWHKIRASFKYILADNLVARSGASGESAPLPAERLLHAAELQQQQQQREQPGQLQQQVATNIATDQVEATSLASMKFEHFESLMSHDKLNVDNEESIWLAIKLWCSYNALERADKIAKLLTCMRFPRFRSGTEFSARHIWRDPLVLSNKQAQQQLAILDRNHRDYLANVSANSIVFDGHGLPCAMNPRQLRPRVPQSILLAIGGWQQGQPTRLIESYDVNCNLWFQSKRRIMSPLAYHGIEYVKGLLYICGGTDGNEILNEVFTFDPVRGECAQKPSMRESRCYVSTACLGEEYLYAIGGHNGSQRMKSVERFCLESELWAHVRDMNVARSDASACVYKSLIYIAGGLNDQVIESSCEFYNAQDDTWTFISSMIVPRTSFTLLLYRDCLLAIGGNNGTSRLASVEQYSFASNQWTPHSLMKHRRSTFSAALLEEDKLIVVGGYNGQTPFNQVEMYNESARSWQPIQKIRYDRSGLKVVAVSDLPNAIDYTFHGFASSSPDQDNPLAGGAGGAGSR